MAVELAHKPDEDVPSICDDSGGSMRQPTPEPVVGWEADDDDWLYARRAGAGGSDIAPILDASPWRSAWKVWCEKTGHPAYQPDEMSAAAQLGIWLEPWLLSMTPHFGYDSQATPVRTYAHGAHSWRMCSPDGICEDGWIVEAKTAALAAKSSTKAWNNGLPVEYEFQARWNTHVMNAPGCRVIALIGGVGLISLDLPRDLEIEEMLVDAVSSWWSRYIEGDAEPGVGSLDNKALSVLWGTAKPKSRIDLGAAGWELSQAYQAALAAEGEAKRAKADAAASLKHLMSDHETATYQGVPIANWSNISSGARRFTVPTASLEALAVAQAPTTPKGIQ